jgi:hypothetical protein
MRISGKPTYGFHNNGIPGANIRKHFMKLFPIGIFATGFVDVDLFHAQFPHQYFLPDSILLGGGDSDISYLQNDHSQKELSRLGFLRKWNVPQLGKKPKRNGFS